MGQPKKVSTVPPNKVARLDSLNLDSLHGIVSFLTPLEFRDLNRIDKALHTSTNTVLAKIKLHAFKCAMEVIVAFKLGYFEDARELAALYISHGVPIYSNQCLGHAYHTIHWRLHVEAQQLDSEWQDPFYGTARTEFRNNKRYSSEMTYLEEKCLFFDTHKKMNIHQHLLDQHSYNAYFVQDDNGRMAAPGLVLSADFFQPKKLKIHHEPQESELDILSRPAPEVLKLAMDKDLDVYSVASYSLDCKKHLQSRFQTYQRRLESLVKNSDHVAYEETMLDFWDEFFPHTAGIHYHDTETAVPRISGLQKFLTKPCPKAIGTVQCEIERIKITSRGKGVKGRLFPTYEYRLFIRNRPSSEEDVRRDTVLMVAKNRGRKHAGELTATSKKGSNNYYLYLPQQRDVDTHFNKVNNLEKPARLVPNGASPNPVLTSDDAGSVLLGRLQSNFIGTEFQIFTPRLRKLPRRRPEPSFASEDDIDYDSGVSSDNNSLRKSRFGRLSLRRAPSSDVSTGSNEDTAVRPSVVRSMSSPDINFRQPRTNRRAIANEGQRFPVMCEEEDGAITYTANLLGSRPRIMDVCIPTVNPDGAVGADWQRHLSSCEDSDEGHMLNCFRQLLQQREENEENEEQPEVEENDFGLLALQNRPPWWNVEVGSFVLNFGGRVSVASVKNFQLCEKTNQDRIMLQFGRIMGRHSFTMDFQHPLTAVQAFSIAISSLQSKISFG